MIILLSLIFVFVIYRKVINEYEWNKGKCPHCKPGIWTKEDEKELYKCSSCKRTLFKL